jgi:hypothetical protein
MVDPQDQEPPYDFLALGLREGKIIPFFGAAASAVYRPKEEWHPGKPFMPFGSELAAALASSARFPAIDADFKAALAEISAKVHEIASIPVAEAEAALAPVLRKHFGSLDLALVASWAEHVASKRWYIDQALRKGFKVECTPGLLHTELAAIQGTRLFVTTNYDDLLEKALAPREPNVVIDRGDKGLWAGPAGTPLNRVSPEGGELNQLLNDPKTEQPSRPIIYKMHGSVDKINATNDHYLITEEDYTDFLGRMGGKYIPVYIDSYLRDKDFLFLGYSLEDWNVRVILRKLIKRPSAAGVRLWAIVRGRSEAQQKVWQTQNLTIYSTDLQVFARELGKELAKGP